MSFRRSTSAAPDAALVILAVAALAARSAVGKRRGRRDHGASVLDATALALSALALSALAVEARGASKPQRGPPPVVGGGGHAKAAASATFREALSPPTCGLTAATAAASESLSTAVRVIESTAAPIIE